MLRMLKKAVLNFTAVTVAAVSVIAGVAVTLLAILAPIAFWCGAAYLVYLLIQKL